MDVTCSADFTETQVTITGQISYTPFFEPDPYQVEVTFDNDAGDAAELDFVGYGIRKYTSVHYDSWAGGTVPVRVRVFTDDNGTYEDFNFDVDVPDFGS
jgi:hypothetical protein